MGHGFKGGRGGANPLNFKVVGGTTKPSKARENTFFVNTDKKITSWVFSADEPSEPEEGMVWFDTGIDTHIKLNALKRNGIMVYPILSKQYVDGAFVTKTSEVYQAGKWVGLDTYLYNLGDECTELTGGWTGINATVSNGSTSLQISVGGQTDGSGRIRDAISLAGRSLLSVLFDYSFYNVSDSKYLEGVFQLRVVTEAGATAAVATIINIPSVGPKETASGANITATLDISSFADGLYYVEVYKTYSNYVSGSVSLQKVQLK